MNEKKNNSSFFATKESSTILRTCTSCCPFDANNLSHPQINFSSIHPADSRGNRLMTNPDACCLNKLQVDCRIQCRKKKKKFKKGMKYDSKYSSQSIQRSNSTSSSQLSPDRKRKKYGSNTDTNNSDSSSSSSLSTSTNTSRSEQSISSNEPNKEYKYHNKSSNAQVSDRRTGSRLKINQNIQDLKTSIDQLTQLMVQQQTSPSTILLSNRSISLIDKFRRFFQSFFKSSGTELNDECCQILQRHHLTKENLLHIFHLFDKNETIFLNWLRTIMPEYFLPLLLNYVKHFDSISTDNH